MPKIFFHKHLLSILLLVLGLFMSHNSWSQAYRISDKPEVKKKPLVVKTVANSQDTAATPVAEEPKKVPEIKNLKIISEIDDGKGNFVRTVQYNKGSMRVTETIIKPKSLIAPLSLKVPINPDTMDKRQVQLVVDKTAYMLKVFYRKRAIRAYKVTFGPQPKQDKCMEGDRCTPEGSFTITNLNPKSMYNKFMLFSYPNEASWAKFNELKRNGKIPASARIGGAVGIHGIWRGGDELIDLGVGWTDGCVALKNKDVDELFTLVGIGTKVIIKQ